jgi:hypothetical protein
LTISFAAPVGAEPAVRTARSASDLSDVAVQQKQTTNGQTTLQGREFGQHVSGMAPEHPKAHGRHFGECVSELAMTGVCPHHESDLGL